MPADMPWTCAPPSFRRSRLGIMRTREGYSEIQRNIIAGQPLA